MGLSYALAHARRNNQVRQIQAERDRIINLFAVNPYMAPKVRAVNKVAKSIILNGPYCLDGVSWDVKAKSLGAGVYELSLVKYENSK